MHPVFFALPVTRSDFPCRNGFFGQGAYGFSTFFSGTHFLRRRGLNDPLGESPTAVHRVLFPASVRVVSRPVPPSPLRRVHHRRVDRVPPSELPRKGKEGARPPPPPPASTAAVRGSRSPSFSHRDRGRRPAGGDPRLFPFFQRVRNPLQPGEAASSPEADRFSPLLERSREISPVPRLLFRDDRRGDSPSGRPVAGGGGGGGGGVPGGRGGCRGGRHGFRGPC